MNIFLLAAIYLLMVISLWLAGYWLARVVWTWRHGENKQKIGDPINDDSEFYR